MNRTHPVLLLLTLLAGCTAGPPGDAPALVRDFYAATAALGHTGAPTPEELTRLSPYLSDSLQDLLSAAHRRQVADLARAPDEKPAFAEGDLFSSLFEGPTRVTILADSARGADHAVVTRMDYDGNGGTTSWTDTVLVRVEHGRFVISNIAYGGDWDFANRGTLMAGLAAALAEK